MIWPQLWSPAITSQQGLREMLDEWFATPLGSMLREQEQAELDAVVSNLFGYHLLQLGSLGGREALLPSSRIHHHVICRSVADCDPNPASIVCRPSALPVQGDSIDVMVLPHALEFEADPHQVLREVERVLVPEGHVVILGFNPRGLWGLWKLAVGRMGQAPWSGQFLAQSRLRDWLRLLGFDIELSRPLFCRPPLQQQALLRKLEFLDAAGMRWCPMLAAVYLIVAKKRVSTLTPIKPRWKPKRNLVPGGVVEPSTRAGNLEQSS